MPRSIKYSYKENAALARAYKRGTDDPIAGTDQSAQMFFAKVIKAFANLSPANYAPGTYRDRSKESITQQLGKIKHDVQKFNASL